MNVTIPLSADPNQTYSVTVSGNKRNITFIINQSYNEQAGYWTININDQSNQPILTNIPLFAGADLLEQYKYLNIGHIYVINIGDQTIEYPNDTNISENFELLWVLQ